MIKIIITIINFLAFSAVANNNYVGKNFLCKKMLWGFEFISSNKLNIISTNLNNVTSLNEYYYEIDSELPYINIYSNNSQNKERLFSIHIQDFRVDIWTMTAGGITTREIIPAGFCQEKKRK